MLHGKDVVLVLVEASGCRVHEGQGQETPPCGFGTILTVTLPQQQNTTIDSRVIEHLGGYLDAASAGAPGMSLREELMLCIPRKQVSCLRGQIHAGE